MNNLLIKIWDVEHGLAVYIKTPNDRHIVYDLGKGSYKDGSDFSPLNHIKRYYDVDKIDYLFITHPHKDHIEDIVNLDIVPDVVVRPKWLDSEINFSKISNNDKEIFEKYIKFGSTHNLEAVDDEYNIEDINYWGGVKFSIFVATKCSKSNFNNHSIILVIEYKKNKIILTGDNEKCSFDELLEDNKFKKAIPNADILLAPHHGRESAYHEEFLKEVLPCLVVISDKSVGDTSVTDKYRNKVFDMWSCINIYDTTKKEYLENRKVLTTRNDGVITIEVDDRLGLQVGI